MRLWPLEFLDSKMQAKFDCSETPSTFNRMLAWTMILIGCVLSAIFVAQVQIHHLEIVG